MINKFINKGLVKISILLVLFFAVVSVKAQTALKQANKLYNEKAYAEAIPKFKAALKKAPTDADALIKIAECYRLTNQWVEAKAAFAEVVKLPEAKPVHKFYYGQMLMQEGKYDEAKTYIEQYTEDTRGENIAKALSNVKQFFEDSSCFEVKSPKGINSDYNDFSAVIWQDGVVFASSRPKADWIKRTHSWTDKNFYSMYYAGKADTFTYVSNFGKPIKTKFNNGPVCFTKDGKEMWFTRNNIEHKKVKRDKEKVVKLKIFKTAIIPNNQDNLSEEAFPFIYNMDDYNIAHPAMSPDGSVLVFSSDMPGSVGGMDLWMCKQEGNTWGKPINLGNDINTKGNEVFPVFNNDGYLYFSSNGLPGLGGLDIFETKMEGNLFIKPFNFGAPVNSSADDFGLSTGNDGKSGYFTSNRKSNDMNDDIYEWKQVKARRFLFELNIVDSLTNAAIENASARMVDSESGEAVELVFNAGKGEAKIIPNRRYTIEGIADTYINKLMEIKANREEAKQTIQLVKSMVLDLRTIVYDNPKNKKPVANAKIILTGKDGKTLEATTDTSGVAKTEKLQAEENYVLVASANGVTSDKSSVNTVGQKETKTYQQEIYLSNLGGTCIMGVVSDKSLGGAPCVGATVTIIESATRKMIYETKTDETGSFKTCVAVGGQSYRINISKENYFSKSEEVSAVKEKDVKKNIELDKIIVGKGVKVDNIYFAVGKWNISKAAAKELDKIVKLMVENPDLVIELGSHTDCRSDASSNLTLSDKRAKASAEYIMKKGNINAKRISGVGYGETQLTNTCDCEGTKKSKCTDKQHAANRRTELKVIGFFRDGTLVIPE